MTISEAKEFYKKDNKKYEIKKNKEFLSWFKKALINDYNYYIEPEELQELINNIANWYEIKYPERELEYYNGIKHTNFQDIKKISNVMTIRQLLYRLPHKQLCLMECGYRAKSYIQQTIYKDNEIIGYKPQILIKVNKKSKKEYDNVFEELPWFMVKADYYTGKIIKDDEIEKYTNKTEIKLDELLVIFNKNYRTELDFIELEKSINNHNYDIELRNRILQMVALKLLYSKNTIPERGYERSKRFINEFNKNLNLNLSTKELDEIMNKHKKNNIVKKNKLRKLINK